MTRLLAIAALAASALLCGCDQVGSDVPASNAARPTAGGQGPAVAARAPAPAALPPADAPLRPGGSTIENPDAEMIAFVYHGFAGSVPLDEWAESDVAAGRPDEFAKAELLKQRRAQLGQIAEAAAKVGRFTIPVRSELSEYDRRYGEYYVGLFSGNSSLGYNYRGRNYRLEFVNKDEAQPWKIPADEARHIFERNDRSRAVIVTPTVEIVGFNPVRDGGALKLKVLSYVVDSQTNASRLGQVTIAAPKPR